MQTPIFVSDANGASARAFRAETVSAESVNASSFVWRITLFVLVVWLALVVLVSYFGLSLKVAPLLRGPIVVLGILVPVLLTLRIEPLRRMIDAIPDATIVAAHGWRIIAGFAFLSYGAQGLLPPAFARNAGHGDIAVAALVPVLLLLPESRRKYLGFHLFGLADFCLAVGSGLYFTLLRHPLQENLFTFPMVLIPWFVVGLSGASHLLVLHRLLFSRAERH